MKLKWSLRQLLLVTATVALGAFIFRAYLSQQYFTFAFYLMLTSLAGVGACRARGAIQAGCLGATAFGILYLVCVLKAGLEFKSYSEFQEFNQKTEMGFAFMALSFLMSNLCALLVRPREK